MRVDVIDQTVGVLAHFKEIRLFLRFRDRASAVRTFSVDELAFRPEGLAGGAVPAFIRALVDVALIVQLLKDLLDLFLVLRSGCPDEAVVAGAHQIPDSADLAGIPVNKFLGRQPGLGSLDLIFLTMLVGSGLENDIVSFCPFVAGDCIRQDRFIGVSDVRLAGGIGDCGCNIIWFSVCHVFAFLNRIDAGFLYWFMRQHKRVLTGQSFFYGVLFHGFLVDDVVAGRIV